MHPRIRTVKPETFTDELLWDLSEETGLPLIQAYIGLWCYCDRDGKFEWRVRPLKLGILPYWHGDFEECLDTLHRAGRIVKYTDGEKVYGMVRRFTEHQSINNREQKSVLPDPDECRIFAVSARVVDASLTGEARDDHASSGEQNRTEPNGTELSLSFGARARGAPHAERAKSKNNEKNEQSQSLAPNRLSDASSEPDVSAQPTTTQDAVAPPKNASKRVKGKRLCPPDWKPSEALRAYALDRNIDPDEMAETMRDWSASGGNMKLDWDATFRGFCRREANSSRPGQGMTEQDRRHVMRERREQERARQVTERVEDEYAEAYEAMMRQEEEARRAGLQ